MSKLLGKQVIIVGASSGIGLASAQAAAEAGAHVLMLSRSLDKLQSAAQNLHHMQGGSIRVAAMDMLDEAQVENVLSTLSQIDHLVLTAAADENKRRGAIQDLSSEQMERSMDKLRGFFFVARYASTRMSSRGSMTFTSGGSALKPPKSGMSILAGVNASVIAFSHALALELAPVRVNCVTPGVVDTPVWKPEDRERIKTWAESPDLPAQRFAPPSDIAQAILFLMANPYVTGHNLVVDGGLSAL